MKYATVSKAAVVTCNPSSTKHTQCWFIIQTRLSSLLNDIFIVYLDSSTEVKINSSVPHPKTHKVSEICFHADF